MKKQKTIIKILYIFCISVLLFISSCSSSGSSGTKGPNDPGGPANGSIDPPDPNAHLEIIYDDELQSLYNRGEWAPESLEYNDRQTAVVYDGDYAIEVTDYTYGFLVFDRLDLNGWVVHYVYPNQFKNITFFYNPGPEVIDDRDILLTLDKDVEVRLADYLPASISPDTWYRVSVPLEDMNPGNEAVFRFYMYNVSGSVSHYYLDHIAYEWYDDTDAPEIIGNVNAEMGLYNDSATLTWETNELVTWVVEYGAGEYSHTLQSSDFENEYVQSDNVVLTNLVEDTEYQYRITLTDHQFEERATRNTQVYTGNFRTRPHDDDPPEISEVGYSDCEHNRVVISWTTDEMSSSIIHYGTDENNLNMVFNANQLTDAHEVRLIGLDPLTTYYYRVESVDVSGNSSISDTSHYFTTLAEPTSGDVVFTIDPSTLNREISPYIYGTNDIYYNFYGDNFTQAPFRLGRFGGNRLSAYNWENNASNAGSDWHFQNDGYLEGGDTPGGAVLNRINTFRNVNCASLITIPIGDYVAADKNTEDVRLVDDYLNTCYKDNLPFKESAFSATPSTEDDYVYQDEFVNLIQTTYPDANSTPMNAIFYCLDNEPDIWYDESEEWGTHETIHPNPLTYQDLADSNILYARAVKSVAPDSLVFGFVSFGFSGFYYLQGAPDWGDHGLFIDYYLDRMQEAESVYGQRLVDVLDIHWYPEASDVYGNRIGSGSNNSPEMVAARVQSPRTLWDPTYRENSWIANDFFDECLPLLPWIQSRIDVHYQGTKLAITEYYYGGGDHISGGIAQADVLGIFAREGVFAATIWPNGGEGVLDTFIIAAFNMFLNYDNNNSSFGNRIIGAAAIDNERQDNNERTSIYASLDSNDPGRMVMIAINKSADYIDAEFNLNNVGSFTNCEAYRLNGESATIAGLGNKTINGTNFIYSLEPYSIYTLVLTR